MVFKNADNLRIYTNSDVEVGEPVAVGQITGVALTNEDDDGYTVIRRKGVFKLTITTPTATINIGDPVYYSSGVLNNDDTGVLFGYALEQVSASTTKEIHVLLK